MKVLPLVYPGVLALLAALFVPVVVDLQPRPEIALSWWAAGAFVLALGAWRGRGSLPHPLQRGGWIVAGTLILWALVVACITTQLTEFGAAPGRVWGLRGLALTAALIEWVFLLKPPDWLRRGMLVSGLVTALTLVVVWAASPPVGRTVSFYWLAADSTGRLYATETDLGVIWAFDPNGTRSNLWPRRAAPGRPGPGLQPSGFGSELSQAPASAAASTGGLTDANLAFCGLAVDPQDRLYMVDAGLGEVRRFTPDGQLAAAWRLPDGYAPTRGCIAADQARVFVGDNRGMIYVYDADGILQAQWNRKPPPRGLALANEGLCVLQATEIAILDLADGRTRLTVPLPKPTQGLAVPYQTLLAVRSGEFLVSDANQAQLRRFGTDGHELSPLGRPVSAAGQFAGGWPGEVAEPAGLAEDAQHRIYVADSAYRLIQRFRPDGVADEVLAVPEAEAFEMRAPLP